MTPNGLPSPSMYNDTHTNCGAYATDIHPNSPRLVFLHAGTLNCDVKRILVFLKDLPCLNLHTSINTAVLQKKKRLKASCVDIPHCNAVLSGLKGKGRLSFLSAGDRNGAQNITHSPVRRPVRGNFIIEHPIPIIRYRRAYGTLAQCPSDCYP